MALLDPVLGWTLAFHPFITILILSVIVTLVSTFAYKYLTDQAEMKRLKTRIESFKKEIKDARDNPKKMMKLNQEAMEVNMQYFRRSLKPMLFTFLPIIIVFSWMGANLMYDQLAPGEPLIVKAYVNDGFTGELVLASETLAENAYTAPITTDGESRSVAAFAVQGDAGTHNFTITYNGESYGGNTGTIVFGENPRTTSFAGRGPIANANGIVIEYPRIRPLGGFHIGSWYPGWIAVYILLSIVLSVTTRRLLKIY